MKRIVLSMIALFTGCGGSQNSGQLKTSANHDSDSSCSAGNADACALAGMSRWLDEEVDNSGSRLSHNAFVSGCELSDWFSCAMAGSTQVNASEKTDLVKKAHSLALTACEDDNDGSACAFLGDWAEQASQKEDAQKHYGLACGLSMTADTREKAIAEFVCRKALEFGATEAELQPIGPGSALSKPALRTSGIEQIRPPGAVERKIHHSPSKQAGAQVLLCLSEAGVPQKIFFAQFSKFPEWNQKIFETMRDWRYSPAISSEGLPVPICTSVTFHFIGRK